MRVRQLSLTPAWECPHCGRGFKHWHARCPACRKRVYERQARATQPMETVSGPSAKELGP